MAFTVPLGEEVEKSTASVEEILKAKCQEISEKNFKISDLKEPGKLEIFTRQLATQILTTTQTEKVRSLTATIVPTPELKEAVAGRIQKRMDELTKQAEELKKIEEERLKNEAEKKRQEEIKIAHDKEMESKSEISLEPPPRPAPPDESVPDIVQEERKNKQERLTQSLQQLYESGLVSGQMQEDINKIEKERLEKEAEKKRVQELIRKHEEIWSQSDSSSGPPPRSAPPSLFLSLLYRQPLPYPVRFNFSFTIEQTSPTCS